MPEQVYEHAPLQDRPLMPNVHTLAGLRRGEPFDNEDVITEQPTPEQD